MHQVEFLKENNQRKRYLEAEELTALLDACKYERSNRRRKSTKEPILVLRQMIELAVHTGLRKNELHTRKWSDIVEINGTIGVRA